jgi:hypothetical protein
MFLHVSRARVLDDHRLWVEFDNGVAKEVDLSNEMHGEVFEPLRSPEMFASMVVNEETGTIEWPNGRFRTGIPLSHRPGGRAGGVSPHLPSPPLSPLPPAAILSP